ncbi:MAG TPA: lysine--tRNA ligase [Candidatus Binataceae bacterium]|nr:lysine--tRNA ligase [Candidatus Binataceae bacterium]
MAQRTEIISGADLWPYEEAQAILKRVHDYPPERPVIIASGFGPSGLPHLGTMGEILRPSYIRHALRAIEPSRPSRLIVFIDDLDGLRKVPESIPNREATAPYLGQPVSRIPDPFDDGHPSFADHMIALLGSFLEPVEVEYELMRSSEMYRPGRFDEALRRVMGVYRDLIQLVTPTLREENRKGWSPFMPVCPQCGQVNSTLVTAYHPDRMTVEFSCERSFGGAHGCAYRGEQSVLGGMAKVQWKVDWALRWYVLQVDYELYGKDLIDSARLSGQILRILGGNPPLGFPFEMYLDEEGHKVSKSIGRGVGVEQWRRYAPIEVLKYFLILNPRKARKLFVESIPQYVDEYLDALRAFSREPDETRKNSLLNFVLQRNSARRYGSEMSFGMIMNLVGALGSSDRELIWNYLRQYDPALDGDDATRALANTLLDCALNYYADFVAPSRRRYLPVDGEREQLAALKAFLDTNPDAPAEAIEKTIYDLGRTHYDKPGKIFPLMYRAILGQERGPRLGAFIKLATPQRISALIDESLRPAAAPNPA